MEACLSLPRISREACTGCGDCVETCHAEALTVREGRAALADPDACDYCTECEAACPVGAISCPFEISLDEDSLPH